MIFTWHARTCQLHPGYILYTSRVTYARAYPMPAMLWLFTSHANYALAYPMPHAPCQLCSGFYLYLTRHMPRHTSYALATHIYIYIYNSYT